jgi:RHS repeat-associated protein
VNWLQNPTPNDGTLTSSTTYDALNRPTAVTAPDNSIYRPTYNDANLLEKVDVNLHGATTTTPFVTNIDYNAKGQRTLIRYGSDAQTTYDYDKETFRLTHLKTTRPPGRNGLASQIFANPATVQDLRYTYDPAGNITRIADEALKRVTHAGQIVEPVCRYTYDAIYRLIEATGREHIDQTAFQFAPPDCNYRDYPFVGLAPTNDLQAVRNYTERYVYDPVGNFERMIHDAANGGWTRAYEYAETSLIEDGLQVSPRKTSNRLSRTLLHPDSPQPLREPYTYDPHGNMTTMPHLPLVQWDFKDQLRASSKQVTTTCPPETTFYVYDAAGQRVRKVTERQNGTRKDERIYLGGFEVYREYNGNGQTVTLERETVHVMDNQQRIALVETKTRASGLLNNLGRLFSGPETLVRYQLGNHLGSASLELDKNGGLISYEEYHPYGTTAYQAITSAAEGSLKRYRYTGKERDAESGLYYHGARYYAAWLARWTAADPAGMIDGSNVYLYVAACPIRFRDRDGRQLHPDMMESMRQDYEERRNSALDVQEKAEWDAYRRKLILEGNYDVNVEDNPDLQALKEQHIEDERQATEDTVAGESLESGGVGFAISAIIERKSRGVSPNARDFATVGRPLANTARARAATPSTAPPMPAVTATTKPPAPPPPPSVTAGPPKKPLPPPKPPTNASSAGSAPPAAPPTGAPAAQRGRNITISGTMSEEEFRGSMKTEPGVYVYVIVDAQGNVSKPGTTTDPYKRFNDYVNKEGMGTAQMRVYRAHGKYQALGGETAAIAAETERGSGTMNDRLETRTEMRQGGEWTDSLYQPPAPSGPPLITIKR